jgi:hypothetical protein
MKITGVHYGRPVGLKNCIFEQILDIIFSTVSPENARKIVPKQSLSGGWKRGLLVHSSAP